jgi:hypothetical protein
LRHINTAIDKGGTVDIRTLSYDKESRLEASRNIIELTTETKNTLNNFTKELDKEFRNLIEQ